MRTNVYKQKILSLLGKKHLLSIADIHKAIPEADYSTIFRNVEQLEESGELKKILIDTKTVMYERGDCSHHHFVCTECNAIDVITFDKGTLPESITVSDVTVRGSCADCA